MEEVPLIFGMPVWDFIPEKATAYAYKALEFNVATIVCEKLARDALLTFLRAIIVALVLLEWDLQQLYFLSSIYFLDPL